MIIEKRLGLREGPSDFDIEKPAKLQRSPEPPLTWTSKGKCLGLSEGPFGCDSELCTIQPSAQ